MTPDAIIALTDFKFVCPICEQHLACVASQRGTQIQCPCCQQDIIIPPPLHLAGHLGTAWTPLLAQRLPEPLPTADPDASERSGLPSKEEADQWHQ